MFYVAAGCEGLSYSCLAGTVNETTSALLGTRPDETTFSSTTSPGVAMMS